MVVAVADTHVALWYLFDDARLSANAGGFLDQASVAGMRIAISSISLAEVVYLVEKGRVPGSAYDELVSSLADPDHFFVEVVFDSRVVEVMRTVLRSEVPDMPDRMIAATAVYLEVPVISRDRQIRAASVQSIW